MAKLTKLYVENFKKIQAVEVEPEGNITIVGGLNEQGKSSLLDSISVLFQGKAAKIPEPVRKGAKKATITGDIQSDSWDAFDSMTITRTITANGNWYVKVQDKDGKKYNSPEGMLKEIFGQPVDVCEFVRMTPAERVETLKRITGLDFSELDRQRKELYDERTLVGREVKQFEGSIKSLEVYPDAPQEKVSVSELMLRLSEVQAGNRQMIRKKEELEQLNRDIEGSKQRLQIMEEELERLQEKIHDAQLFINGLQETKKGLKSVVDGLVYGDEEDLKNHIAKADKTNNQIEANIKFKNESEQLENKKSKYQAITCKIEKIDTDKQKQLSEINFPVPGLSFNDNDVLYNDLPFDAKQLSSEELLRVSFAVAIAARPNLKNILIREGSLLDENNLKLIGKMAEDAGIHCFVEVVGDDADKATIVIENGIIKGSDVGVEEVADEDFADI
uniref:Putative ATPase domain containing protein n=1 Tax=viral metagenome TaxID=1070528 RepID=A0A6M3K1L1_9ZZZZ